MGNSGQKILEILEKILEKIKKCVDIRIAGWYYVQVADEKRTSLNK